MLDFLTAIAVIIISTIARIKLIHMGASTQIHDHEILPVSLRTMKMRVRIAEREGAVVFVVSVVSLIVFIIINSFPLPYVLIIHHFKLFVNEYFVNFLLRFC